MKILTSDITSVRRYSVQSCNGCVFMQNKVKTCLGENKDTYDSAGSDCKSKKFYHRDRIIGRGNLVIGDLFLYDGEIRKLEKSVETSKEIEWSKALGVRITPETLEMIHFHKLRWSAFRRVSYDCTISFRRNCYFFKHKEEVVQLIYIHEIQYLLRKIKKHPNI